MKLARTAALVGVALLCWAFGPVVLLLAAGSLCFRRVRAWLRPSRRVLGWWVVAVLVVAGLAYVLPDGWVRMPPGAGALVTPAYVGRPAIVTADRVTAPLGESPRVTSRSYRTPGCRELAFDDAERVVTACGGADAPVLRLLDADSLRQQDVKTLPGGCAPVFDVAGDRTVVAAGGRRLLVMTTADAEGRADLTTVATVDLPDAGCPTGVAVDGDGHVWFATADGRVGVVADGRARTVDLHDRVERPLAAVPGAAYVAGAGALHQLVLTRGRPVVAWSSAYDDGGSRGAAPVVLPTGLVAVADDRSPRMQVVVHRTDTGDVVCRTELFEDDRSSTDGGMVAAGNSVLVLDQHGYAGPLSTALGRTTTGGLARVDVVAGECRVGWESDLDAPSGAPAVSTRAGLAYVYTKRHSWLGADAWYLSAVELDSGRAVWARRTGLGVLADNHHGRVALGPDGAAYVPVLGGFVRVADRD
ncbi:hypothetical protein [Nocardioides sp.]|uniref:hypothetical protein n=1 Tax=Nocardioides sp. TaxID=35761 RepID=UPI003783483D